MKKTIIITFLLIITNTGLYAQSNFKVGYIVNLIQDTIKGYIDYNSSTSNEKICVFKKILNDTLINYSPSEIMAYGIQNLRYYESRFVNLNKEGYKHVFIEKIVQGKISLFKYDQELFVQKNNTNLIQLENNKIEGIEKEGRPGVVRSNKYVGILSYLTNDRPEMYKEVQRVVLSEQSITNILEKYNAAIGGPNIIFKSNLPWTKIQIGLAGGYNFSNLNIVSNEYGIDYLLNGWDLAYAPTFSAFIDIASPRLNERFKFTIGASYFYAKYLTYAENETVVITYSDVKIEISAISIPIGIRYTLPINKIDLNFAAGITRSFAIKQSSKLEQDINRNGIIEYYTKSDFLDNKTQGSYWLSIGLSKAINSKMDGLFEIKYERGNGYNEEIIVEEESYDYKTWVYPNITNFQIMLGIRF